MERKNWIGAIILGILGLFGIGTGIKRHQRRKEEELEKQRKETNKRDRLLESVQRNQLELTKSQQETLKIIREMQTELGIDPTTTDLEIDDNKE